MQRPTIHSMPTVDFEFSPGKIKNKRNPKSSRQHSSVSAFSDTPTTWMQDACFLCFFTFFFPASDVRTLRTGCENFDSVQGCRRHKPQSAACVLCWATQQVPLCLSIWWRVGKWGEKKNEHYRFVFPPQSQTAKVKMTRNTGREMHYTRC